MYVYDLALKLKESGHVPIAFSTQLGVIADELIKNDIQVTDNLNEIERSPDIIHGHHHLETLQALCFFQNSPAIYFCHGAVPWEEAIPKFSRIFKYIAVDEICHERINKEICVDKDKITIVRNFVDLTRFTKKTNFNKTPKKALIFSNYAKNNNYIPVIAKACKKLNIQLDIIGQGVKNSVLNPEKMLFEYDIVFAKAKAAMEALAVGCAVIVCDKNGLGGMVKPQNLDFFIKNNFGLRTLDKKINLENILTELKTYDCNKNFQMLDTFRQDVDLNLRVQTLLDIYYEAIDQFKASEKSADTELKEMASYLHWLRLNKNIYLGLRTKENKPEAGLFSRVRRILKTKLNIKKPFT